MKDEIRIGIYMRLSKEDRDITDESNSITNQRLLLKEYVRKHFSDYKLYEFWDDGYSGTNFNRPGMKKLLKKIRNNDINCVIVKDFSRFSRDYIELGSYIEQIFPFMNIHFISIEDNYDSENDKGMLKEFERSFKNLFYDLYSKDLSVKVKSALKVRKDSGKYISTYSPFGYQKNPKNKYQLLVNAEEALIVQRIFELTMQGMSCVQIARLLNENRIKTPLEFRTEKGEIVKIPKGDRFEWGSSVICQILRNQIYTGDIIYNKYEKTEIGKKPYLKPRDKWKILKNQHEAIIDREIFDKVQEKRGKKRNTKWRETYPLTGKLVCGCCRKSLRIRYTSNPYFTCIDRYSNGRNKCIKNVNIEFLEQFLFYMLNQGLSKIIDLSKWKKEKEKIIEQKKFSLSMELKNFKFKLIRLEKEKRELYESYVLGEITFNVYSKKIASLNEKKNCFITCMDDLEKQYDEDIFFCSEFTELKKAVIDIFITKIIIYDEKHIEIIWNFK